MRRLTFLLQLKEWSHLQLENKWLKLLSIVLAVLLFIFFDFTVRETWSRV